MIFHQDKIGCW